LSRSEPPFRRWRPAGPRVLALVSLLCSPAGAAAQTRVTVTPYFTTHFPLQSYDRAYGPGGIFLGEFKQTNAPGVGAKISIWLSPDFALESDFNYVLSGTRVTPKSEEVAQFEDDGHQIHLAGLLAYRPNRWLVVSGGGGFMLRGGDAWRDELAPGSLRFKRSNFTTVFSLGAFLPLAKGFTPRLSVDALVYWAEKLDTELNPFHKRTWMQEDIEVKLGVPIGL